MIFVWRKLGFLAVVIPFSLLCIVQIVVDSIFGEGFYSQHDLIGGFLLMISGFIVFFLGRRLNNPAPPPLGESQATPIRKEPVHTFFWIPMEFWGGVAVLWGIVVVVA
ncbi:MAG: hypothetical protein M5R36_25595 [Deltaproteobacteria bacterium]|nr:hypothetical protein [Deltaproteobacteria bacterium]